MVMLAFEINEVLYEIYLISVHETRLFMSTHVAINTNNEQKKLAADRKRLHTNQQLSVLVWRLNHREMCMSIVKSMDQKWKG